LKKIIGGDLVAVMAIMAVGTLSMSILQPILPLYLTSIGIVPTILGLMFSVAMVGMVIGEGFWGWLTDRIGMKIPLWVGTVVCALVVFCFVLTQQIPAIFLIFLFWGIARSAIFPIGRGYIGSTAPLLRKATFMAIYAAIMLISRYIDDYDKAMLGRYLKPLLSAIMGGAKKQKL
jgi:MFS family permease